MFPYGHRPNCFRPTPSVKRPPWHTFLDPIFSSFHLFFRHCQNEFESAKTILASALSPPKTKNCPLGYRKKVLQAIWESLYTPSPLNGNAYDKVSANAASSFSKYYKKSDGSQDARSGSPIYQIKRQTNSFQKCVTCYRQQLTVWQGKSILRKKNT